MLSALVYQHLTRWCRSSAARMNEGLPYCLLQSGACTNTSISGSLDKKVESGLQNVLGHWSSPSPNATRQDLVLQRSQKYIPALQAKAAERSRHGVFIMLCKLEVGHTM